MKKILILLFVLCMTGISTVLATTYSLLTTTKEMEVMQQHISEVGYNILNSNGIDKRMIFIFDNSAKTIDAGTSLFNRSIYLNRGMYNMLDGNDELAAVLAHEISHGVDSYDGIFKGVFSGCRYFFTPRKYEYKADKRAVDYMVNAGYNPVAMIVVLNKAGTQTRYDWWFTYPLTSRRMMQVYEYIYTKYPEYLANNKYKNNLYYQNFLLTSKENRAKFQEKVKTKSTKKVKYQ